MQSIQRGWAGHITVHAAAMLLASLIIAVCAPFGTAAASGQEAKPPNDSRAPRKCAGIIDARDWLNPFIIVNAKDVVVIEQGDSVPRHEMPLSQLATYLKRLPKSAWPCGKVVAAAEAGLRGLNDGPAIKENCSKLNKILKGLRVKADWWPSA
jgi:hypothetical protein